MELKENSFLARYYMFMFNGNLPKDFCTLFWNTLISAILFPIIIPYMIVKEGNPNLLLKTIYGAIAWVMIILFSMMGVQLLQAFGWKDIMKLSAFLIIPLGLVAIAIAGAIFIGVIVGIGTGTEKLVTTARDRRRNRPYKEPIPSKLSIIWATIRNKYCTRIIWK